MTSSDAIVLPDTDVEALLEYSCSLPTGTTIGKRWKRLEPYRAPAHQQRRYLGEYVEHADPDKVGIRWTPLLTSTEAGELAGAILWWLQ